MPVRTFFRLGLACAAGFLMAGLALLAGAPPPVQALEKGEEIFERQCASCHTIGGGRRVGPDLRGVAAGRERGWLIRAIVEPDKLLAEKDPIATQLVQEFGMAMPNLRIPKEDAELILAFLGGSAASSGAGAAPLAAGDPVLGKDLFTGAVAFHNRGPSCLACHSVAGIGALGGGTLGPDLTDAYGKFKDALVTWPRNVAPMQAIYSEKPLTPEEQSHLLTFLGATAPTRPPEVVGLLAALALAGAAVLILLAHFLWRGRLGGVRRPLIIGPRRTSRTP